MYNAVLASSLFTGGFIPYQFLVDAPIWLLIVYVVVLFGVLVVGYILHLGIIRLKFMLCPSNALSDDDNAALAAPIVEEETNQQ